MGEIREKVRLTNATDEVLQRRGQLAAADVHWLEAEAIVDTGAVRSVIPGHVADQLGVQIRAHAVVRDADGQCENVGMTDALIFECLHRTTFDEALITGDTIRIGRTVLAKLDLLADCANRRLIPHPDRPDQPVSMLR